MPAPISASALEVHNVPNPRQRRQGVYGRRVAAQLRYDDPRQATVLNETVGNMERRHTFYSSQLFFLIAANQAVDFGKWAVKTGAITADVISELLTVADDINELRNMNEHVLEYFQDKGRFQHEFIYATDQAIADASSTIEDRIGNRLS